MFEDIKSFFSHNNQKQPGLPADNQEPSRPSIIVVANQKGGCGKTTTTTNLADGY